MGYRSDVGLALSKRGVEILHARLNKANVADELREDVRELLNHSDEHHADEVTGAEAWRWSCIKWYDTPPYSYEEVQFLSETMREMDDADYRILRIGEDFDDAEASGEFWENPFDLEIVREISLTASNIVSHR